jgi:hypothetical protein
LGTKGGFFDGIGVGGHSSEDDSFFIVGRIGIIGMERCAIAFDTGGAVCNVRNNERRKKMRKKQKVAKGNMKRNKLTPFFLTSAFSSSLKLKVREQIRNIK